jgi:hypothetical protein
MTSDLLAPTRPVSASITPVTADSTTSSGQRERNQTSRWARLCQEFMRCHRRPINILLHLVTTPLGLFGLLALVHAANALASVVFTLAYAALLMFLIPAKVWLAPAMQYPMSGYRDQS